MATIVSKSDDWVERQRKSRSAQARSRYVKYGLLMLAALACAAVTGLSVQRSWPMQVTVAAVAATALLAVWAAVVKSKARRWKSWARAAQVGADSERQVVKFLARDSMPGVVYNSVLLGAGGDVDHVWVSPQGLVAVETKTGRGKLYVRDDSLWCSGRVVKGDPTRQVLRQARALVDATGLPVHPVVVVPGASNVVKLHGVVCGPPSVLKPYAQLPATMSDVEYGRAVSVLDRLRARSDRSGSSRARNSGRSRST